MKDGNAEFTLPNGETVTEKQVRDWLGHMPTLENFLFWIWAGFGIVYKTDGNSCTHLFRKLGFTESEAEACTALIAAGLGRCSENHFKDDLLQVARAVARAGLISGENGEMITALVQLVDELETIQKDS